MEIKLPEDMENVIINTGNILSLNDIKKKPSQNPTEELVESIRITLSEWANQELKDASLRETSNVQINRNSDDLLEKMAAQDRRELKVGVKIFISNESIEGLNNSINNVFTSLNIETIDNLVLAYNSSKIPNANEGDNDDENILPAVQGLWKTLESYVVDKKIQQIGLADVDETQFRTIYEWAEIKPSIIQINLASCCVVPPTLQAFCKENDVQLLTHSDPTDILPKEELTDFFGENINLDINWVLKFQVHVKCRGVLSGKGYIVNLKNNNILSRT